MRVAFLAGLFAGLLSAGAAVAQAPSDFQICNSKDSEIDPDRRLAVCSAVLKAGTFSETERAIAYYNRAVAYEAKNDPVRARADYDRSIALDPNRAAPFNNRGAIRLQDNEDGLALADFEEALRLDPRLAFAYSNRANYYSKHNKIAEALADYDRALRLDPTIALAYTNRGNALSQDGDHAAALAQHNEAIRRNPRLVLAYNNRAGVYRDLKQFDRALADLDKALELSPANARALANRGVIRLDLGDQAGAQADFERAMQIEPDYAFAVGSMGALYARIGRFDDAIVYLNRAIALDPRYVPALTNRGIAYGHKGDFARATVDFDEAIRIRPAHAEAWRNRALAKLNTDDVDGALADCLQAIRFEPEMAAPYSTCGKAYALKGNYPTALAAFSKAIELGPTAEFYGDRAVAYRRLGRPREAMSDLTDAIRLDGDNALWLRRRGETRYVTDDLDGARADYEAALQKNPRDSASISGLAEIYRQTEEFDRALALYEQAEAFGGKSLFRSRGFTYIIVGRYDRALADLERARTIDPADAYAPLWIYLVRRKTGARDDGALTAIDEKVDMRAWPGAVVRFFRGEIAADAMRAAARVGPDKEIEGQICEAGFYLAQARLFDGAAAEGKALLQEAARTCPRNFYEYHIAKQDLARLTR